MIVFVDSNVLVAASVIGHEHGTASRSALVQSPGRATASHCLSELYNTLTKPRMHGWPPERAAAVVRSFGNNLACHAMTPDDHALAIEAFAQKGGIGARLYDYLIGETAARAGADCLLTWNVAHFTPLFSQLTILTPSRYLETL